MDPNEKIASNNNKAFYFNLPHENLSGEALANLKGSPGLA